MVTSWDLKLNRARQHLSGLTREVDEFMATDPVSVEVVPAPGGSPHLELRLAVESEPPPRWSTLIGDVLHNTRSALDSLGYRMVTLHATRELSDKELGKIGFPIAKAPEQFEKNTRWDCKGATPPDLRADVVSVQPFADTGWSGVDWRDNRFRSRTIRSRSCRNCRTSTSTRGCIQCWRRSASLPKSSSLTVPARGPVDPLRG